MCNNKALALTVQQLLARLNFSENGSICKVKVTIENSTLLIEASNDSINKQDRDPQGLKLSEYHIPVGLFIIMTNMATS